MCRRRQDVRRQSSIEALGLERRAKQDVVAGVLVNQHRISGKRRLNGADDWQFFVLDLHEVGRILSHIAVTRHDDGDAFTDKAHAVDRHRFASDRLESGCSMSGVNARIRPAKWLPV